MTFILIHSSFNFSAAIIEFHTVAHVAKIAASDQRSDSIIFFQRVNL